MMSDCLINDETLRQSIAMLYNAFIDCPSAIGEPYENLEEAIKGLENFMSAFEILTESINFSDLCFLKTVDDLVGFYHQHWRRPFPKGAEKGQMLISAIMEKVLRTLLKEFERIKNMDYDKLIQPIELDIDIGEEAGKFREWADSLGAESSLQSFEPERSYCRPEQSSSFTSLAIAFIFGWWLGVD